MGEKENKYDQSHPRLVEILPLFEDPNDHHFQSSHRKHIIENHIFQKITSTNNPQTCIPPSSYSPPSPPILLPSPSQNPTTHQPHGANYPAWKPITTTSRPETTEPKPLPSSHQTPNPSPSPSHPQHPHAISQIDLHAAGQTIIKDATTPVTPVSAVARSLYAAAASTSLRKLEPDASP